VGVGKRFPFKEKGGVGDIDQNMVWKGDKDEVEER
jgi:hypothetical protein